MLGNAASGPSRAPGSEQRSTANLPGLLAARQRLLDAGDTDAASRLTEAICARLRDQGDLAGAAALGQAALDAMPSPSAGAARWLHELGTIAQLRGDDTQAHERHLLAAAMFSEVGDPAGVARSYDSLGTLAHARGDYQQAEHYYQAATCFHAPPPPQPLAQPSPLARVQVPAQAPTPAEARRPLLDGPSAELAPADITPADPRPAVQPVSEAASADSARATRARAALARVGTARARAAALARVGTARARTALARVGTARARLTPPGGRAGRPPAANSGRRGPRAWPPGRARRAGGMRPAALAAGTVVVAAGVAIAAIASNGPGGSVTDRADPARAGLTGGPAAGAAAAGAARVQAAAWVARQVSSGAVVSCDPAMCTALRDQGVAAGNLLAIGADGQSDPLGSDIVVATAAVRGTLGTRLARVYAPLVVARFGNGSARIEVRVTAPEGSAAYLRALRADRAARVTAGRQLLANRRLSEAAGPGRQLAGGQVDSRLLTAIAALTAVRRLRIVAFAASGPGADPRVPLPTAEITAAGSRPAGAEAALSAVAAFLRAQRSPYLAAVISRARLPSGQPVLRVAFGEPSPLGLLGLAG
jgi:Tetratricopeptide repeat